MIALRSALFNVWALAVTLAMTLLGTAMRLLAPGRTLGVARAWASLVLLGLKLCGIRVEVSGREHLPTEGPALIASEHQSAFDILIWFTLLPRCCFVAKRELRRIPLFGALLEQTGTILVDRAAGAAAMRHLLRDGDRAMRERRQIVIFPEGTRAQPGARLPLQPGIAALAARTRMPVVPVRTDSGLCWGRRAFRKQAGVIHVAIQPPLAAGLPRTELMRQLEAAFADVVTPACPVENSVSRVTPEFPDHRRRNL